MNRINRDILGYLKSKYPRAKNLFVPYELNVKFEEINYITLCENNILLNAGFTFTEKDAERKTIITKTKKFINSLLNEVD